MTRTSRPLLALLLILPLLVLAPPGAGAATVERASGTGRIQTAVALSVSAFPDDSTDAVVIAAAGDYPDALAAAPLAAAAGAPVLLNPQDTLHDDVRAEIQRLMTDTNDGTAYLMGGTRAQSTDVERTLRDDLGLTVERIEDQEATNRFGTAAAAATRAVEMWGGDAGSRVLVALGAHADPNRAWPDALASGALSGHARWPILLVSSDSVPAITNETLRAFGTDHATVVGGRAAIPDSTKDQLDAETRDRIGGKDRFETSVLLAGEAARQGASISSVIAATGGGFADGLAAGPAAFAEGGVTVLVATDDLVASGATKRWLEINANAITGVLVAGGTAAVSAETAGQIGFATSEVQLTFEEVASGFSDPTYVTSAPGDDRLYVLEQAGRIRLVPGGGTFLDISSDVSSGGERGLLGLAFHPAYADNGRYFIHYTRSGDGATVVQERNRDSGGSRTLLTVAQPASNHNGGQLEFGPDGKLYLGLGDGGGSGDQYDNAQDTSTLLGAIVRIDPDGTGGVNHMHGLRNPYRFSIDPVDELIYIGDVGQDDWEEVDVVPYTAAGTNFGWNEMEGNHCYPSGSSCDPSRYTLPALEYPLHQDGTLAVTGGVVYRGSAIPEMRGQYLYADWGAGWVRGFHYHAGVVSDEREWFDTGDSPTGFGFGPDGEVHIALHGGSIVKIVRG